MYEKYIVYIDDGESVFKTAVAAVSEDAARAYYHGNGEVIAVKDVTDEYPIDLSKVRKALKNAEFGEYETSFICQILEELQIAE